VSGPTAPPPADADRIREAGCAFWPLALARELDDLILHLRTNEEEIGLWVLRTAGRADLVEAYDRSLATHRDDWLVREVRLYLKRTFKRIEVSSRSVFALIEPGSCYAGTLLELALAADRSYMLEGARQSDARPPATIRLSELNFGAFPMVNGLTRLASRFLASPDAWTSSARGSARTWTPLSRRRPASSRFTPDDIDWDDEVRIALEERAAFSPTRSPAWRRRSVRRARDAREQDLRPSLRVAELDLPALERRRPEGRAGGLRHGPAHRVRPEESVMASIDYSERIPNNVSLSENRRLQARARGVASESFWTGGWVWARPASRRRTCTCAPP